MPSEEKTRQADADIPGDDERRPDQGAGAHQDQPDAARARAAGGGHVPLPRAKPQKALTAHDILNIISAEFVGNYAVDTGKAWSDLMLQLMRHLAALTESGVVTNLKEILAVAREVEEHIRKVSAIGGSRDGEQRLPMDEIGSRWRVELPSDALVETPTQTKKVSRRKTASASKSTTSNESPNSSVKTKLETNGSGP